MRKRGASIRDVEKRLAIPRSTLSGWFRNVELSDYNRKKLAKRHGDALTNARIKAVIWHNEQKAMRLAQAKNEAEEILRHLNLDNQSITELALAMLYYGEGSKSDKGLVLGNSNVELLKFFVSTLKFLYKIELSKVRCELHLRADQKATQLVTYWSKNLGIPENRFRGIYFDKRTAGRKTYDTYYGVCVVSYDNVAIQRKLMYLYSLYCQKVIQKSRG